MQGSLIDKIRESEFLTSIYMILFQNYGGVTFLLIVVIAGIMFKRNTIQVNEEFVKQQIQDFDN